MVAQRITAAEEAIASRDTKYAEQLRAALTACRSLLDRSDATFVDYDVQSSRGLQLVHGDFHIGNLLISGESIFGVVDFEDVRLQTALYDLGYACVMLCAPWKQPASDKPECLNERFLRCVLDAYFGPGGQPPITLYRAVILACFLIVSWLLERSHLWQESNQEPLTCLRRMISVCKYYI
jgi:thiamine kinase-like enzyme